MEILSFIGIVLAIVCFIFLALKRVNLFLGTIAGSIIAAAFSQMNILDALSDTYMTGFTSFVKSYSLLFFSSAIFGRCIENSGCARKAGLALVGLASRVGRKGKNLNFKTVATLPIIYFFLAFSGIHGFVLVFTLLAIGREMFHDLDIPWYIYPYGSGGIMPASLVGGSLYMSNIMFADGFGVGLASKLWLSIISVLICFAVLYVMLYFDLRKADRKNEKFFPTGQGVMDAKTESVADKDLPNIWITIICLATPVVSILAFGITAYLGLILGAAVTVVLNIKRFNKNILGTLAVAVTSAAPPVVNTCGAVGLVSVLRAATGFGVIINGIDVLPPLLGALVLNLLFAGGIGSATSHIPVILPTMIEKFAQAGISNELAHRLSAMSICTYMTPHNSGPVNGMTLCRYEKIGKPAWLYFKTTFVPGIVALIVAVILTGIGAVG